MANWTLLFIIESTCASVKQALLAPSSMVYVMNWVAQNSFLAKFMYVACRVCHKSMESGCHCHHEARAKPIFCFQIVLFDVVHGGIPLSRLRFGIMESYCLSSPLKVAQH